MSLIDAADTPWLRSTHNAYNSRAQDVNKPAVIRILVIITTPSTVALETRSMPWYRKGIGAVRPRFPFARDISLSSLRSSTVGYFSQPSLRCARVQSVPHNPQFTAGMIRHVSSANLIIYCLLARDVCLLLLLSRRSAQAGFLYHTALNACVAWYSWVFCAVGMLIKEIFYPVEDLARHPQLRHLVDQRSMPHSVTVLNLNIVDFIKNKINDEKLSWVSGV